DSSPTEAKINCREVITKRGRINALMKSDCIKGRRPHGNLIYRSGRFRVAPVRHPPYRTRIWVSNIGCERSGAGARLTWNERKRRRRSRPSGGKCPRRRRQNRRSKQRPLRRAKRSTFGFAGRAAQEKCALNI